MARPRKKRRKQVYDKLWDTDPLELARLLNIGGVGWIAQNFDCSPTTIWRATKAKGLKPGKGGKYVYQPPDRDKPDEIDAWVKMVEARPRRGPSTVLIGDAQEIFGGRRTERALPAWRRRFSAEAPEAPSECESPSRRERASATPGQSQTR